MGAPKPRLAWAPAVACMLLALVPAPARAAPTWTATQSVAAVPTTDPISPVVGVDAAGDAVALWADNGSSRASAAVWAAVRPAGGGWQAPVELFAAAGAAWVGGFDLAVNARGDAVAVWEAYHCTLVGPTTVCNYQPVQAAVGSALTGSWQAPVTLGEVASTTSSSYAGASPRVAIDAGGNATAVWQHYDGSQYTLSAARLSSVTGAWTAPAAIFGNSATAEVPDLAVDPAGDTVVGYGSAAASYPAGASGWTAPVNLTSSTDPIAQVAIDAHGNALATWIGRHTDINNNVQWLDYVATMPAGGAWQAPVVLSDGLTLASDARIAVDAAGDAAAVWSSTQNGVTIVAARTKPATSSGWYPVTAISGAAASFQMPDVAVDSNGNAVALWQQHSGGDITDVTIQAAVHPASPANASWEPLTSISSALTGIGTSRVTHLAADAQGDVVAVWSGSGEVQAAAWDGGGPALNGLTIPLTGTAGQPLSFTVSPLDVWSAPGVTSWSFGDGTTTTGTAVSHTFAAAGTYPVTVTGADALGNATTATRTMTIAPASGTPANSTPGDHAPAITRVRQSHRRWREGSRLAHSARRKKPPIGTAFTFTLDQTARVSLSFRQVEAGRRRVRGRCVGQTRRNRHARFCRRMLTRGTLTATGHPGTNRMSFQGRLSRTRRLRPGRYTVQFTAVNAAGKRSRSVSLSFTIVKG